MTHQDRDRFADPTVTLPFRLGDWHVHPQLNRISAGERVIQLGPRLMHILVVLAARPGEVVSREALMAAVWHDAIVSEETLTVAVSDLRRSLGDDPRAPRYIETIRKGGYRMIAPVTTAREQQTPGEGPRASRRAGVPWSTVAALSSGAVLIGLLALYQAGRRSAPEAIATLQSVPLTSYPSSEITPAISHDGLRVAFAWGGEAESGLDLYVKQVNTDPPMRLTDDPAAELFPAWSPKDDQLAFARVGRFPGIYVVPSIGGVARRLVEVKGQVIGLDWSPDGQALVFSTGSASGDRWALFCLTIETGEVAELTRPTEPPTSAFYPAWSPDGRTIAFVRSDPCGLHDIWLMPAGGGDVRRLTHAQRRIDGLDWTADGRALVFASAPTGDYELWLARVPDGELTWLPSKGDIVQYPSVSARGERLVYENTSYNDDIWEIDLTDSAELRLPDAPLIASTHEDSDAAYSWDGHRIAFISTRSGRRELWICERDGGQPWQLSDLNGIYASGPEWSPDGRQIAFRALEGGWAGLYVIDVATGRHRRLHALGTHEILPHWSRDGQWLYYTALEATGAEIRRTRPDGSDTETLIRGATGPVGEMDSGPDLLYLRDDEPGIWRRAVSGGEERCVVTAEALGRWSELAMIESRIFLTRPHANSTEIRFLDLETGAVDSLATVRRFGCAHLAAAPDGSGLLYDHSERLDCDLMLVDRFR